MEECPRRVRAALRTIPAAYEVGDLKIDFAARRVLAHGNEVHLTPIEFKLLSTMARSAGKVLLHRQLLTEVWGPHQAQETHYLRVFMANLRRLAYVDIRTPGVTAELQRP